MHYKKESIEENSGPDEAEDKSVEQPQVSVREFSIV